MTARTHKPYRITPSSAWPGATSSPRRSPLAAIAFKYSCKLTGYRSLADGRGDSLDGTGTHVSGGEHAGAAGLQEERLPLGGPVGTGPRTGLRLDEALVVPLDLGGIQSHRGIAPMKLNSAGVFVVLVSRLLFPLLDRGEAAITVQPPDLGVVEHLDVGRVLDPVR